MEAVALEARLRHMAIADENDNHDASKPQQKAKVASTTHLSNRSKQPKNSETALHKTTVANLLQTTAARVQQTSSKTRHPLSVVVSQESDEAVNEEDELAATDLKSQARVQGPTHSHAAQIKGRQSLSQLRHPLSVLSQAPNAAVKREQHTVRLAEQPQPKVFHLGMFEVGRATGQGKVWASISCSRTRHRFCLCFEGPSQEGNSAGEGRKTGGP
jgi:aurora kinase